MIDVEEVELEEWGVTQVCRSFHLHIKCYLVSYGAQAGGWEEPGAGHCCPEAEMGPCG